MRMVRWMQGVKLVTVALTEVQEGLWGKQGMRGTRQKSMRMVQWMQGLRVQGLWRQHLAPLEMMPHRCAPLTCRVSKCSHSMSTSLSTSGMSCTTCTTSILSGVTP